MFFGDSNSSYYPLSNNIHSPSFTNQERNTFPQVQQNFIVGPCNYNHIPYMLNNPHISENSQIINANNNVIPFHYPTNNRLSLEASAMANQESSLVCASSSVIDHLSSKKSNVITPKKDRHTKICTAQGVRDRRVRLSIHIAREFFNLQDKLGFDKASKTLGWLLAKSRAAIDELASSKMNANNVDEDSIKEMNENKTTLDGKATSKKKRGKKGKCKEGNNKMNEKEIRRAKARERARERTKMKKMMMLFNFNNQIMENFANQRAQMNPLVYQSSFGDPFFQFNNNQSGIKSKLSGSYYHDYSIPNEMSSKYHQEGYYYNNIDHHSLIKIVSESNDEILGQQGYPGLNVINLSTEIHINAKPWSTYSNQIMH